MLKVEFYVLTAACHVTALVSIVPYKKIKSELLTSEGKFLFENFATSCEDAVVQIIFSIGIDIFVT